LTEPKFDIFIEVLSACEPSKLFRFSANCLNEALPDVRTSGCLTEILTEPITEPWTDCKGVTGGLLDSFCDCNGFSEPFIDFKADFYDPLADNSGFSDSFIDF